MSRRLRAVACLSLAATAAAVPADAAACERAAAQRRGTWFTSTQPHVARTPVRGALTGTYSPIRAVGIDPTDPRVLFVTDGGYLARSDDGGCTWRIVWTLPDLPGVDAPGGDTGAIRSIDVARVGGRQRVLLALDGAVVHNPAVNRPVIVRSDDGRTGWTVVADPAFAGSYHTTRGSWAPVVRSSGATAYAALPSPAGTVAYFRSADGGRTWTRRSPLPDPGAPFAMTGFAVNPWNPDELWEWGGAAGFVERTTRLRRSTDGGATWAWVDPWPAYDTKPGWTTADVVWPRRGGPARVVVPGNAASESGLPAPVVAWSGDGGASFRLAMPPTGSRLNGAAVTHLANGDVVLVAPSRAAYRIAHRGRAPVRADWRPLPPAPEPPAPVASGYDAARATATMPGVVVVPSGRVQLLTVPR